MILSVHIPKTAGVSVRNILKEHYGPGFILHYWQITDAWGRVIDKVPAEATCVGHYQADLLAHVFPAATLMTWVRDPVERVVSSYYHRLRDPDWQHPVCVELHQNRLSLADYSALPLVQNEMTRFFGSKKPEDFAFIGVVEDFEESLAAMKRFLGIPEARLRRDNVNPGKQTEYYAFDPRVRREIERNNASDLTLYEKCLKLWREKVPALTGPTARACR
ncbi:MAG: sulfotransferase family 2 domain-containing protein [Lacunisphaera sp.]